MFNKIHTLTFLFVLTLLLPQAVFAGSLNDDSQDFATLRASNYTDNPGCSNCWTTSVSADSGDSVSLSIY